MGSFGMEKYVAPRSVILFVPWKYPSMRYPDGIDDVWIRMENQGLLVGLLRVVMCAGEGKGVML